MRWLIALLLFPPSSTWAQSPPASAPQPDIIIQRDVPTNSITTQSRVATPPPISSPMSIGAPHVCIHDYPREAVTAHAEGTTTVGFTITVNGTTEGVRVVNSSGNEALDNAAVACASRWIYRPARENGNPLAVPWKAEVRWALGGGALGLGGTITVGRGGVLMSAPVALGPHNCSRFATETAKTGAVTTLKIHITAAGAVDDVTVAETSGSAGLDRAAVRCARVWSYLPAKMNGQPMDAIWRENVAWAH